jgi:hypothetical protein
VCEEWADTWIFVFVLMAKRGNADGEKRERVRLRADREPRCQDRNENTTFSLDTSDSPVKVNRNPSHGPLLDDSKLLYLLPFLSLLIHPLLRRICAALAHRLRPLLCRPGTSEDILGRRQDSNERAGEDGHA